MCLAIPLAFSPNCSAICGIVISGEFKIISTISFFVLFNVLFCVLFCVVFWVVSTSLPCKVGMYGISIGIDDG
jgi:hypothetical protein